MTIFHALPLDRSSKNIMEALSSEIFMIWHKFLNKNICMTENDIPEHNEGSSLF